jgi:hypothetical protein
MPWGHSGWDLQHTHVVEAGEPVPWTKPDELLYQKKKDLPALGGLFDGVDIATGTVTASARLPECWWQVLSPSGNDLARFEVRRDRWPFDSVEIWDVTASASARRFIRISTVWLLPAMSARSCSAKAAK